MYILFHGAIFDPADLVMAEATDQGLYIQTAGAIEPTIIRSETKNPMALLGELYQFMLEAGIGYQPEAELQFELEEDEVQALSDALAAGYEYVARDKSGKIWAYRHQPKKYKNNYEDAQTPDPLALEQSWFSEIDFDAGPVSIAYMILDA